MSKSVTIYEYSGDCESNWAFIEKINPKGLERKAISIAKVRGTVREYSERNYLQKCKTHGNV